MKTLIIKSLLPSLYQREEMYPSFPHSGGFAEAKTKRGKGRFFNNDALLVKNPAAETAGRQSQNSNSLTCSRLSCPIVLSTSELRQRPQGVIVMNSLVILFHLL